MAVKQHLVTIALFYKAIKIAFVTGILSAATVARDLREKVWPVDGKLIRFGCVLGS